MRMETFIRKALQLKAHHVVKVEEPTPGDLVVSLERVGQRRLRCGACGQPAARAAATRRPLRRWQDLAMRQHQVSLVCARLIGLVPPLRAARRAGAVGPIRGSG